MKYRSGDQVRFEADALVEGTEDGKVVIRFGQMKLTVDAGALEMIRRAVHVGDKVLMGDADLLPGTVSQQLEDDAFLIRLTGRTGVDAYRIAETDELQHDDGQAATASPQASAPSRPAAVVATGTASKEENDHGTVEHGVGGHAGTEKTADSEMTAGRSPRLDLESLGTSKTVPSVVVVDEVLVLGADMQMRPENGRG